MTKSPIKFGREASAGGRKSKPGKSPGRSNVLGKTKDGVLILKPRAKATHFTQRELRDVVASVRASKRK